MISNVIENDAKKKGKIVEKYSHSLRREKEEVMKCHQLLCRFTLMNEHLR